MKAKLLFLVFFLGVSLQSLAQINIITQPVSSVTKCEGGTLILSVEATGTNLTYQWYFENGIISGATTSTLTIPSINFLNSGTYYCRISSTASPSVNSSNSIVILNEYPSIVMQPVAPAPICEGQSINMSVTATGSGLIYQWYHNGVATSIQNPAYQLMSASQADAGSYYCVVAGACFPSVTSVEVQVVVNSSIAIQAQPVPFTIKCKGSALSLYVSATGTAITYQWFHDNSAISGATNATLNIASLTLADAGTYKCFISSPTCPSLTSTNSVVTVNPAPTIAPIAPISACNSYTLPPYNDSMFVTTGAPVTHYYLLPGGPTVTGNIEFLPGFIITASQTIYPFCQFGNSCFDDTPMQITLYQTPVIAPITPVTVCDAYTLPFYNNAMFVTTGAPVTHYYTMPGGPTVSGNMELMQGSAILTSTTIYPYANSGTMPSCWTDAPWQININQAPNIITSFPSITNITVGQSLALSVVTTGSVLTYSWYYNGILLVGETGHELIIPDITQDWAGEFCCVVSGLCAPVANTCTQVTVNPLSVVENSRVDFSVYPNPASNMVTVQYSNASNTAATIAVYDLQGKQALQQEATIENNQSRISIASLQSGLYLIKITTENASVTKKLMVN